MTPVGSHPADPARRARLWRLAARLVALLGAAVLVMIIALALGMRLNDRAIDQHPATATATVLSVGPLRTAIEFVDLTGLTVRPPEGVLYPGLLVEGQQFVVEYSTTEPAIARVAGRTAAVGTLVIATTLAVTALVTVPLVWWLRRRSGLPLLPTSRPSGAPATVIGPPPAR